MFDKYGTAFGVDPSTLQNIAQLESGFNPQAVNDWDVNARAGTPSQGIMQFIQPTFDSFYGKASAARPELFGSLGQKNWMDPEQQIATTAWALSQGLGSHWATYDRAKGSQTLPAASAGSMGTTPSKHMALAQIHAQRGQAGPELMKKLSSFSPTTGSVAGVPGISSGPAPTYTGPVATDYLRLQNLGSTMFGLRNDPGAYQTTGGRHRPDSQHYSGHAIDFGSARNTQQQLQSWWDYLNKNRGSLGVTELVWEDRGTGNEHIHAGVR